MTFTDYDIKLKKNNGTEKTFCPKCHDKRSDKTDKSLSVNISEGLWNCHYCKWTGSLKDKKEYKKPEYIIPKWENKTNLSDTAVKYFESRKISQFTLRQNKVTTSNEWMRKSQKVVEVLNFNYFRNDELVNIKFRGPGKDFKLCEGAELIVYGLDCCKGLEDRSDRIEELESGIGVVEERGSVEEGR